MDGIYMQFFVKNGERMPQDLFFDYCKRCHYDAAKVLGAANYAGYQFCPVLGLELRDHIAMAFPYDTK